MAEEPTYDIQLEASAINTAILQVHAASPTVVDSSDNMVRASAIRAELDAEAADRAVLAGRVTTLENIPVLGAPQISFYVGGTDSINTSGYLPLNDGILRFDDAISASLSSTKITVPAGSWRISVQCGILFTLSDGDPAQNVHLYINGSSVKTLISDYSVNPLPTVSSIAYIMTHYDITEASSFTVGIYWVEGDDSTASIRSLSGTVGLSSSPVITFTPFS